MIKEEGLFMDNETTKSDRCIHTPGNFAKQNLLYVQEVGKLQSLKPHKCIRENLDSYLFMIVLEGKGSLEVKGVRYKLFAGDCALIHCMEHYEHISDEKNGWKLAWVHFNGNAAKGYYELFKKYNNGNVFCVDEIGVWDGILENLLERQKERNVYAELISGEILLGLLNNIIFNITDAKSLETSRSREIATEVREQLNKQYIDTDVLQQLEKDYNISIMELNEIFVSQFGINIEEYVDNRRFNAAKELLRFSIKPIEVVAMETGIGNVITLQKMFDDKEGMTAEEYRAKWAAWIR